MIRNAFAWFLIAPLILVAQNKTSNGSIGGTVQQVGSGTAIRGARVHLSPGGKSADTDDKGRFAIKDLAAGTYKVVAYVDRPGGPHGTKIMQLAAGQDLTVDFRLVPQASISGRVVDENGEPIPGADVFLIAREYRLGALRYVYAGNSETDDRGQYQLNNVQAGPGYLVEATKRNRKLDFTANAPADPKLRKKVLVPAWYPDSDSLDGAQVVVLQPGEHREGMDFRLPRAVSYCIDGVLATDNGPGPLNFSIEEQEPTSGESGDGGRFVGPPSGTAAPDGRFRVCDLHSGVYRLIAYNGLSQGPTFFGETEVPIGDKDVHGLRAFGRAHGSVSVESFWDGKPPDQSTPAAVHLWIRPMTRAFFMTEISATGNLPPLPVPGQFTLRGLLCDDYAITVMNIPQGAYLKEVLYSGRSALHEPMHVGKTAGSDLSLVLAHDGGVISVKVTDKDKNPMPDFKVVLLPASASTDAGLADSMLQGQTDQYGAYSSGTIAPGKYYVLATNDSVDRTPETIAKLLLARTNANQMELPPNGSVSVTLLPTDLN